MRARRALCLILALSLALAPCLSCSSAGGDGGSSAGPSPSLATTLAARNDDARAFADAVEGFADHLARLDAAIDGQDPSTPLDVEALGAERDALLESLNGLATSIDDTEVQLGSVARLDVGGATSTFEPQVVGTVLAVCATGLALGAYVLGMAGAMENYDARADECEQEYLETVLTDQVTLEEGAANFELCMGRARSLQKDDMFFAAGGAVLSFFGPKIPLTDTGKVLVTSGSTALDVNGVVTYYREHDERDDRRWGIGLPNSSGEMTLPAGEWDVVVVADGLAPSAPEDDASVTVLPGDTVVLDVDPVAVEDASDETCDGGEVPPPTLGPGPVPGPETPIDLGRDFVYFNFDGAQGTDPAGADIRLSGHPLEPIISWGPRGALAVLVLEFTGAGEAGTTTRYCVEPAEPTEEDAEEDLRPFFSPLRYGDYDAAGVQRCDGVEVAASTPLIVGRRYQVQVAPFDGDRSAVIFFERR